MHISVADAAMARVTHRGWKAIDRQSAAARATLAFRRELIAASALCGSFRPQRFRRVDLAARGRHCPAPLSVK
jgi:hypothetical protein